MKTLIKYLSAGMLLSLLFATCTIKEERVDCPSTAHVLKLSFIYSKPDPYGYSIGPDSVRQMQLFVFKGDTLMGVWTDSIPQLSPDYSMVIPSFPAGDYRFIVWGRDSCGYAIAPTNLIPGETRLNDITLAVDSLLPNDSLSYPKLYRADAVEHVDNTPGPQPLTLTLQPIFEDISITLKGLPAATSDERYVMLILDPWNGKYKLDGSFVNLTDGPIICKPYESANDAGISSASFRIARMLQSEHDSGMRCPKVIVNKVVVPVQENRRYDLGGLLFPAPLIPNYNYYTYSIIEENTSMTP